MPAELYLRETADLARRHAALLEEAREYQIVVDFLMTAPDLD